jgi:hypothetical protein
MKQTDGHKLSGSKRVLRWGYVLTMIVLGFTGFGQMPIFKRYYISDIPGMAWSADFFVTHTIHYLLAMILLALLAYFISDYFLTGKKEFRLTSSAYLQIFLLGSIVITGVLRVLKNLPDVSFSPGFTLFIDISHLALVMVYVFVAIFFLFTGAKWISINPSRVV